MFLGWLGWFLTLRGLSTLRRFLRFLLLVVVLLCVPANLSCDPIVDLLQGQELHDLARNTLFDFKLSWFSAPSQMPCCTSGQIVKGQKTLKFLSGTLRCQSRKKPLRLEHKSRFFHASLCQIVPPGIEIDPKVWNVNPIFSENKNTFDLTVPIWNVCRSNTIESRKRFTRESIDFSLCPSIVAQIKLTIHLGDLFLQIFDAPQSVV